MKRDFLAAALGVFFLLGERSHCPFARFESVLLVPVKLTGELDKILGRERATRFIGRVIAPDAQRHPIAGICKRKLAVRLLFAGQLGRGAFDLHMHPCRHPAVLRRSANFCQGH